jgi:hypothetical protein
MLLTVGDGLSEKSIVNFDGNAAPFGTMEFAAGLSVTGRECAYCDMHPRVIEIIPCFLFQVLGYYLNKSLSQRINGGMIRDSKWASSTTIVRGLALIILHLLERTSA